MKIAVIEAFFDKDTNEPYNRGDMYEGDKNRVAELRAMGFLADVAAKKTPVVAAETKTDGDDKTGTGENKDDGAADATKPDTDSTGK